jgi:Flp pilus assembly protein TadB
VPEDLGTWSRTQAAVLVKVLRRAGCRPSTTPGAGGSDVRVTVPDDQADRANAAIAAEMDTIARAAREERERNVRSLEAARRKRERRNRGGGSSRDAGERPLATERLRGLAPFLGLLLAALLVAAVVPPAGRFPAMVVGVVVVTYLIGRGRSDEDGRRRPAA